MSPRPERLAVVGGGPRAAYAVELVARLAAGHGVAPPQTDVFTGGGRFGPGSVYEPSQPSWLRLNVASAAVHAWDDGQGRPAGPSFDEWRERRSSGSTVDQFPPRALAGRYLAEFADRVRSAVPGDVVPRRVTTLSRRSGRWCVDADREPYDEVLLAVGHATDWAGALHRAWPREAVTLVPQVFPVDSLRRAVPDRAGHVVVVRGAALTGLDAALSFTQDRRYPARVVLTSRSGRLMMPKTEPDVLRAHDLAEAASLGCEQLSQDDVDVEEVLLSTAVRILTPLQRGRAAEAVRTAADELLGDGPPPEPCRWLRRHLAIAEGRDDPDGAWALGQAWRALYPSLVARQDRGRDRAASPLGWRGYRRWAPELERLAFGPPPVNARALLDLMEQGLVRVERLPGEADVLARYAADLGATAVVDAVLPPPGLVDVCDPLLDSLRQQGWVSAAAGRRGVVVTRDARCVRRDGSPAEGLAAVGRVTEDVVLGNDTLVRTLHPDLGRWARSVLGLSSPELREVSHV